MGTIPYIIGSFLDALIDLSSTMTFGEVTIATWLFLLLLFLFAQLAANIVDWIIDRKGR